MVQQHRIYVLQFDKGEPDQQELSCKVSPPKGAGRRIMYYYHDYGTTGGGKHGNKQAKSRTNLSLRGFFGLLLISFCCFVTLLAVAPGDLFSFARTAGGAAEAAAAAQQKPAPCSGVTGNDTLCCDRTSARADMCFARGDVRMHSASKSFQLVSSAAAGRSSSEVEEERIRPYTRKWEATVMKSIDEVRIRRVSPGDGEAAARCDVRHSVPAVLLSTGGYTGNVYHEFNDGLLPMFVTAAHLDRQVVFVLLEYHDWWITKYGDVVSRLSAFPPIDFTADRRVHCFPELIAGLRIHGELTVDPQRTPDGRKSIQDFRRLLDDAYRPRLEYIRRTEAAKQRKAARKHRRTGAGAAAAAAAVVIHPTRRPRLTIMARPATTSRAIENEADLIALATSVGFEVRVVTPVRETEMCKIYGELNESDAMVGVHGAAMTHLLFMRPGKVFIQVVPLGMDWAADEYYGAPARRLGLRYVGYKIRPDESSLAREYPPAHPVLVDPAAVSKGAWEVTKKIYLDRQNVRLDLDRFREQLVEAHRYIVANAAAGNSKIRKRRTKTKASAAMM